MNDPQLLTFRTAALQLRAGQRVNVAFQCIDGEARPTHGPEFDVISPTTEAAIATLRSATQADVDDAVAAALHAFTSDAWSSLDLASRIEIIERVCAAIVSNADDIARVQTEQMGAPLSGARAAIARRVVANAQSNIRAARRLPTCFVVDDEEGLTVVERRPVGVVAAILPWNAPLSFEIDKVTAALLAGCTVVLKPAAEAPLEALALASLFHEAGLPKGALNVVVGGGDVGEMLVSDPRVARVTFTGSTATGRAIAHRCADRFARVSLELGGKSAAIILPDADLGQAAAVVAASNFGNAGQACHALTRVLVPAGLRHEFVDRVREIASGLTLGDPRATETTLGPLVSQKQRARVEMYIAAALDEGVEVAVGGSRPPSLPVGWFFEPTVLTGVTNDMRVAREEIFGPVMSVLDYEDVDDAVAIANDSDYGLGGAVFSEDRERGFAIARRINTGMCSVNTWGMTRSAPFGGVKSSGVGREHGLWGVAACFETHAVRPAAGTSLDVEARIDSTLQTIE